MNHNFKYVNGAILVLLLQSPLALADQAAQKAMSLIQTMSDAMHHNSYSGDFVYLHGNQLEAMTIQHLRTDSGVKERLFSLNGEAREIFRDDENLTCIWPASRKVVLDKSKKTSFSPLWIPEDVNRLSKFYNFKIVGMGRIANRDSKILSISSKDNLRYGMQIWVDVKDGYLLKSVLFDDQNKIIEQVMFTRIEPLENSDMLMVTLTPQILPEMSQIQSHSNFLSTKTMPDSAWKIGKLPAGFWMESSYKKPKLMSDEYFQHMVFTDGLASFSVFIEKQSKDSLLGESSMGAINAYGMIVNDYSVTAVGEVPSATVKLLVSTISYE